MLTKPIFQIYQLMLTVLPLTSFNAKVPLFPCHSPTLPFTLTLLPRVTSPHHLHRRCWSSYYFLPLLTRQIVQLNGNLLIYFPLMAGKRISSFVSASLCVQSHCTMDWEWMLGFLNNNLHISNLFLESLEKKYVPWISKDNKVFYTDNVYIGSRWW